MKKLVLIIALSAFPIFGQIRPTPTPLNEPTSVVLTKDEEAILSELEANQIAYLVCASGAKVSCDKLDGLIAKTYEKISRSPNVIRFLAARAVREYETLRRQGSISAPQVSQIADEQNAKMLRVIVAQNQRIIELLEQIAKKK